MTSSIRMISLEMMTAGMTMEKIWTIYSNQVTWMRPMGLEGTRINDIKEQHP
jgi:hypothetical protein